MCLRDIRTARTWLEDEAAGRTEELATFHALLARVNNALAAEPSPSETDLKRQLAAAEGRIAAHVDRVAERVRPIEETMPRIRELARAAAVLTPFTTAVVFEGSPSRTRSILNSHPTFTASEPSVRDRSCRSDSSGYRDRPVPIEHSSFATLLPDRVHRRLTIADELSGGKLRNLRLRGVAKLPTKSGRRNASGSGPVHGLRKRWLIASPSGMRPWCTGRFPVCRNASPDTGCAPGRDTGGLRSSGAEERHTGGRA